MGGRNSRYAGSFRQRPSRHAWSKIQDVNYQEDEADSGDEYSKWDLDRRIVDEQADWPRMCPIMHLNIQKDFPLDKQRSLVRAMYRFWQMSFVSLLVNFVATMATLLTSNVTNPGTMTQSFVIAIVYLFGEFFLVFRPAYWAIRLESNVLFIWSYIMIVALFALFGFMLSQALGLVSVLAEPLSPGSSLPVKINPIFPVTLFSIFAALSLVNIIWLFYFFSQLFKFHTMSDKKKLELYKKQRRKPWLSSWFGGRNDDGLYDDDADADGKPKNAWTCIMQYEQVDREFISDSEDEDDDGKSKKDTKRKRRKKPRKGKNATERQMLTIPGQIALYTTERKLKFRSEEAIFNNLFRVTLMLVNISALKKEGDTNLTIVEVLSEESLEEDLNEYRTTRARCSPDEKTFREIRLDFDTKSSRDECLKKLTSAWRAVKKKEQYYLAKDEESLRQMRLNMNRRATERASQHLLTHKDWKLMVSLVYRGVYKAGMTILSKGTHLQHLFHLTEGKVTIYLETSPDAQSGGRSGASSAFTDDDDDNFDLQAALFPAADQDHLMDIIRPDEALNKQSMENSLGPGADSAQAHPIYYTVKFEKRKLGFSYLKKKRAYNLRDFEDLSQKHYQTLQTRRSSSARRSFQNNYAAIVHSVKEGGDASRKGVRVGDELVKVGFFDIEEAELTQQGITSYIREDTYPLNMTFRRPPQISFQTDDAGFVAPDPSLVPAEVRETMRAQDQMDEDYGALPTFMLAPIQPGSVSGASRTSAQTAKLGASASQRQPRPVGSLATDDNRSLRRPSFATNPFGGGYETSDEEEEDSEDDFANDEGDLISFDEDPYIRPKQPNLAHELPQDTDYMASGRGGGGGGGSAKRPGEVGPSAGSGGMFEMSRLDLAEEFAAHQDDFRAGEVTEFQASVPLLESEPRRLSDLNVFTEEQLRRAGRYPPPREDEDDGLVGVNPSGSGLLARGRAFLFGHPVTYDKLEEDELRRQFAKSADYNSQADTISIVVERNEDAPSDVDSGEYYIEGEDDDDDDDIFASTKTFEPVGEYSKGDTFGIIPWILNHPVSVVQLTAKTDVVLHMIDVNSLSKLFRRNPTLALAFFKYVAAAIGERADRDEEVLCDQISDNLKRRDSEVANNTRLTRLLDNKPIKSTLETDFDKRAEKSAQARRWFQQDFDMEYDSVIFDLKCRAQIIGDKNVSSDDWHGREAESSTSSDLPTAGTIYLTHFHVCFRASQRALDLGSLKRRPTLYGKVHIDDIYEIRRDGDNGEGLAIITDDVRLDVLFDSANNAQVLEDWIHSLIASGSVVEKAPHSYTLPGDLYGFSSGNPDADQLPVGVQEDPLNVLYTQQRGLRTEFLILTQTLQQVLTKQDRFKMFHDGSSVILRRGQSVLTAASAASHSRTSEADDYFSRRPQTSQRAKREDGPNGLYLVGKGELVLQREVNGRRIQFASYKVGTVFGVERFLTDAPSPFTVKVVSKTALLKFAPRDRCMALLRADLALASRFYQYCSLLQMQRLRGPIISKPVEIKDDGPVVKTGGGSRGCAIL
ncbi:Secretory carrier-associated membrane protein 3 [Hondaea fermentalgiana]|uniref:Secretory carrier-associated membrane protein 3 n=1 Tax=Hondaea fermentalgiana TaxID=2315210 RepID=A0A2R5GCC0_9STRA|nr:Secretory carrier-associated membrane protein 3 [Hondaea fermentalgiana]|eukprot:GBG28205.1 Secretory carrier-associated membrane protein 3 [Hondaea fermentalgiana]